MALLSMQDKPQQMATIKNIKIPAKFINRIEKS